MATLSESPRTSILTLSRLQLGRQAGPLGTQAEHERRLEVGLAQGARAV